MVHKVFLSGGWAFFQLFLWFISLQFCPNKKYFWKEIFLPVLQSKLKTISQFANRTKRIYQQRIDCQILKKLRPCLKFFEVYLGLDEHPEIRILNGIYEYLLCMYCEWMQHACTNLCSLRLVCLINHARNEYCARVRRTPSINCTSFLG